MDEADTVNADGLIALDGSDCGTLTSAAVVVVFATTLEA
jgi:hypothetical protein